MTSRPVTRRGALRNLGGAIAAASLAPSAFGAFGPAEGRRKMTIDLVPGAIGVGAPFPEVLELAIANGYESIAPDSGYLAKLSDDDLAKLKSRMSEGKIAFGAAGLPVDFRGDEAPFREGMKSLAAFAAPLRRAGVTRVGTWLRPCHPALTYRANFDQHARRLREVATVLGDHGLRFGLEYVGPKTSWTAERHPFVHSMAEGKELIAAIGKPNVGFVLDSWHWYTAGESVDDILALTNADVVACDLNDAPAGIPVDQQQDLTRDLPAATGVIDLKAFLGALVQIGYDGPVRAEPFKASLNKLPKEESIATAAAAMKKAFALIGG